MDPVSCPDMSIFEILQDIDLAGSFWNIPKPSIPVAVISKPVLSWAGPKNLIPCFWPGEFIFEFSHHGTVSSDGVGVDYNANLTPSLEGISTGKSLANKSHVEKRGLLLMDLPFGLVGEC